MARSLSLTVENVAFLMDGCRVRKFREHAAVSFMAKKLGISVDAFERFVGENADEVVSEIDRIVDRNSARRANHAKRRAVDPAYRISNTFRARFRALMRSVGRKKRVKTFQTFGYTAKDVVRHITPLMQPGMTWENHGSVWHIDHKRPVASFDFDVGDAEAVARECWALSNLQPLPALENIKKGARYASP